MEYYKTNGNFILKTVLDSDLLIPVGKQITENNVLINVNETGRFICSLLESPRTLPELAARITEEYEVEQDRALADAQAFVKRLVEVNAVTVSKV